MGYGLIPHYVGNIIILSNKKMPNTLVWPPADFVDGLMTCGQLKINISGGNQSENLVPLSYSHPVGPFSHEQSEKSPEGLSLC